MNNGLHTNIMHSLIAGRGTNLELSLAEVGNDVGLDAALCDNAGDAPLRAHLLPHEPDIDKRLHDCVQSILHEQNRQS